MLRTLTLLEIQLGGKECTWAGLIVLLLALVFPLRAQDLQDRERREQLLEDAATKGQVVSPEVRKQLYQAEAVRPDAKAERAKQLDQLSSISEESLFQGFDFEALKEAPRALSGGPGLREALAAGKAEIAEDRARGVGAGPLVFVSFSLGDQALKRYLRSAPKYGATLVFRGFKNNDLKAHLAALKALIEDEENLAGMVVDPTLYHRFGIHQVPSFVLPQSAVPACNTEGCKEVPFIKAQGAAGIERFLEEVRRRGEGPFPELAVNLIERGKRYEKN
ncbi:type-F conjugative transfer system pilin assembly protein TrbC [uncultured Microbulbifer sp.]|uniref:type-F conjugative transfer system pilin assembly protein TrbC n=1 Tax=uncultured Microbulbifer sp. TaxID=348147 RepID=UPI00262D1A25|nr:type-F conjugative transfer system pilin assembly protein TrbC [uncultured Microbulbifer sp.]